MVLQEGKSPWYDPGECEEMRWEFRDRWETCSMEKRTQVLWELGPQIYLLDSRRLYCHWAYNPASSVTVAKVTREKFQIAHKSYSKPRQCFKKQRHHFANKSPSSQGYGLPISHTQMWEFDHKEGRAPNNWCFWIVMLEKTLKSPVYSKEIKQVNLKGNQPWIFAGSSDAEAPILWPPFANQWLIGKDTDAGKHWRRQEKRGTENEMVGWRHQFNECDLGQTLGDSRGQKSLACCGPWGLKESAMP